VDSVKNEKTLSAIFAATSTRLPNHIAIRYRKDGHWTDLTFKEIKERVFLIASAMQSMGVKKGDHIAILSENRPEWFFTDLASLCLGAALVPLYATLKTDQIHYIIDQSESRILFLENREQLSKIRHHIGKLSHIEKVVVFDPVGIDLDEKIISFQEVLNLGKQVFKNDDDILRIIHSIQPDDLASIVYTSGTTAYPKGVMLSHGNFVANIRGMKKLFELTESDVVLGILPLAHVLERCGAYYTAFLTSGAVYVFTESLESVAQDMIDAKPTFVVAVPRLFEKIYLRIIDTVQSGSGLKKAIFNWALQVGRRYHLETRNNEPGFSLLQQYRLAHRLVFSKLHERFGGHIRFFVSGGAALEPRIAQFFHSVGIKIMEGYGLTETAPVNTANHEGAFRLGSVGKPIDKVSLKLAEDGEILVKGPNVTRGYFRKPEETQELFDDEGWLKTGDIGRIDDEGFVWIVDRKKEIIITSGGKNVAPQPIENLLTSNPYINHAMLIGDRKNFISALIVPDFQQLGDWCRKNGLGDLSQEQMIREEDVYKKIQGEIQEAIAGLPRYEQVKRFILLQHPWTVDSGELTPTMKLKRRVILRKFSSHIDALYRPDFRQP
jgi:long-chain acyl-CoA synthetase